MGDRWGLGGDTDLSTFYALGAAISMPIPRNPDPRPSGIRDQTPTLRDFCRTPTPTPYQAATPTKNPKQFRTFAKTFPQSRKIG